jgi:uncharacterized membrane protein
MGNFQYKFASTTRTVLLTLNIGILLYVIIDAYINNNWKTIKVIFIIILGLNILKFVIDKPQAPEIKNNGNTQTPPQTPGTEQDQV